MFSFGTGYTVVLIVVVGVGIADGSHAKHDVGIWRPSISAGGLDISYWSQTF